MGFEIYSPDMFSEDDCDTPIDDLPTYYDLMNHVDLQSEHQNFLEREGNRWLVLKVRSMSPSPDYLPEFVEGRPIEGEVVLNLQKPEDIEFVTISVRGCATFSPPDDLFDRSFVQVNETLWHSSSSSASDETGNLVGVHTWPFSITLPPTIAVEKGQSLDDSAVLCVGDCLPPSFCDRLRSWGFNYELVVDVKRSRSLSDDDALTMSIKYTPNLKEEIPSELRLQAYENGLHVPGPQEDPSGWTIFPPFEIEGKVFDALDASATYTLAIASPMSYAAGSIIPCFLNIESTDDGVLASLSDPHVLDLSIRRQIKAAGPTETSALFALQATDDIDDDDNTSLSTAAWMPSNSRWGKPGSTTLYGEIQLPESLTPSFTFGEFQLKYFIDMHPPDISGFVPACTERVFRTEVMICSVPYDGPRPRSYLPLQVKVMRTTRCTVVMEEIITEVDEVYY